MLTVEFIKSIRQHKILSFIDKEPTSSVSIGIRPLPPAASTHFASLMRKAGADTKAIQQLIGHSKYSFTADVYAHTDVEELKRAIKMI